MKNILVLVILVIMSGPDSFAQLAKGTFLVSGSAGFTSGNYNSVLDAKKHNTSNLLLSPAGGYFILSKLVAGFRLQYSDNQNKAIDISGSGTSSNSHTSNLNIGPFARYYLLNQSNKLANVFIEGSYGFGTLKVKNPSQEYSSHIFSILAGPEIYFNSNIGLEFTIGYYKSNNSDFNVTTTGIQAGLGFQIHLGRDNY